MSESSQRSTVIRALKPLHGIPVENPVQRGTPDVNYAHGWIELKWLRRWPARPNTIVKIDHFTVQQRRWLRKRWECNQSAWLLLQCRREWLLFRGTTAHDHVGYKTRAELMILADKIWSRGLDKKEFVSWLTNWAR